MKLGVIAAIILQTPFMKKIFITTVNRMIKAVLMTQLISHNSNTEKPKLQINLSISQKGSFQLKKNNQNMRSLDFLLYKISTFKLGKKVFKKAIKNMVIS